MCESPCSLAVFSSTSDNDDDKYTIYVYKFELMMSTNYAKKPITNTEEGK